MQYGWHYSWGDKAHRKENIPSNHYIHDVWVKHDYKQAGLGRIRLETVDTATTTMNFCFTVNSDIPTHKLSFQRPNRGAFSKDQVCIQNTATSTQYVGISTSVERKDSKGSLPKVDLVSRLWELINWFKRKSHSATWYPWLPLPLH